MPKSMDIPKYWQFFNPVLEALRDLGDSGTIDEILEHVVESMALPQSATEHLHGESNQTEVGYRVAWARTYLKKVGLITNSERGVWSLTPEGRSVGKVDPSSIKRRVRAQRSRSAGTRAPSSTYADDNSAPDTADWRDEAIAVLKQMHPTAFERLCQRLLRESGFIEVEVTRTSSDGGIDGRGILRLGGLISFTVMFQSKRYADAVGSSVVRDFRGALMGRADKGLIITTGRFTHDAKKEATRDGATPIDLIDGDMLVSLLKQLELGVRTRVVEEVVVDRAFFDAI